MGPARACRRPADPGGDAESRRVDHDRRPARQTRPGDGCRRRDAAARSDRCPAHPRPGRVPARPRWHWASCSRRARNRWPPPTGPAARASTTRCGRHDRPSDAAPDRRPPRRPQRKPLDPARRAAFDVLRAVSERDAYANLALTAAAHGARHHRPRRRVRHRVDLRHLPHPRSARRGDQCRGGPADRQHRPGAAGPAAARRVPVVANTGRAARRGVHHRRAGGHRIRFGTCGFRQRRAAHHRAAATNRAGSRNSRRRRPPTRSATWPSATRTRDGSRRRSPTRSAPAPVSCRTCSPPTTNAPSCTWPPGPAVLTAAELADAVGGTVGSYSPYAVYLPGGDPGRMLPVREGQALVQDEGSQLVARALAEAPVEGTRCRPVAGPVRGPGRQDRPARRRSGPSRAPG